MPLLARTITAPVAIEIRHGAVASLGPLLADGRISARGDVAIAVGPGLGEEIAERLKESLPSAPVFKVVGGSHDSARDLLERLRGSYYDAIVGIGGGGTIDVAKYAASMIGLPFVSVATNLAHDGIASPVSVLESNGRKGSFGVHVPIAVVVDLDYVARSPVAYTRSGIGDAVSNISAVADWELAGREQGERVDGLAVTLARAAAESLVHRTDDMGSATFLTALAEALFMGGLAMTVAGSSRPCSGACHEISHAIDALEPGTAPHGALVAVGTLFASFLREDPALTVIDACFRRYGLPRSPTDLGLSVERFTEAVLEAPSTRPDRYTILEHLSLTPEAARQKVDAFVASLDP